MSNRTWKIRDNNVHREPTTAGHIHPKNMGKERNEMRKPLVMLFHKLEYEA